MLGKKFIEILNAKKIWRHYFVEIETIKSLNFKKNVHDNIIDKEKSFTKNAFHFTERGKKLYIIYASIENVFLFI